MLSYRAKIALFAAVLVVVFSAHARAEGAIAYLESLKGSSERYKAPSELDPRYTIALYVNAATRGPWRQRMWVLQRSEIGGPWRLAMWDKRHWRKAGLGDGDVPNYSWPVSTGRYYRGERFSGPTPTGVFALDERRWRHSRGWSAPGMIHTMYIDFHYSSGRRSGVAFHGTSRSRYRRLGTADSHGCIRMHQTNALALYNRVTGRDDELTDAMRWGDVPRFWKNQRGQKRSGYTRDGTVHSVEVAGVSDPALTAAIEGGEGITNDAGNQIPDVLTKTGFRAIAVIFKN